MLRLFSCVLAGILGYGYCAFSAPVLSAKEVSDDALMGLTGAGGYEKKCIWGNDTMGSFCGAKSRPGRPLSFCCDTLEMLPTASYNQGTNKFVGSSCCGTHPTEADCMKPDFSSCS